MSTQRSFLLSWRATLLRDGGWKNSNADRKFSVLLLSPFVVWVLLLSLSCVDYVRRWKKSKKYGGRKCIFVPVFSLSSEAALGKVRSDWLWTYASPSSMQNHVRYVYISLATFIHNNSLFRTQTLIICLPLLIEIRILCLFTKYEAR